MTTPNDSSTGGYLQPAGSPAPLEGKALMQFVQQWVVGVSGLPGQMVRPRWQTEPPDIPQDGTCWCAIGITSRPNDEFPFVGHDGTLSGGLGGDTMQRHEQLSMLASFYDQGVAGEADYYCALFRDGAIIEQNRAPLLAQNMVLVRTGAPITVPSLLKLRWLYRVDLEVVLRRQINRNYPVRNLVAATGTIYYDEGLPPQNWQEPPSGV